MADGQLNLVLRHVRKPAGVPRPLLTDAKKPLEVLASGSLDRAPPDTEPRDPHGGWKQTARFARLIIRGAFPYHPAVYTETCPRTRRAWSQCADFLITECHHVTHRGMSDLCANRRRSRYLPGTSGPLPAVRHILHGSSCRGTRVIPGRLTVSEPNERPPGAAASCGVGPVR